MSPDWSASSPFWQRNLDALQRRDPGLARCLSASDLSLCRFAAGRARDGSPVLGMLLESGKSAAFDPMNTPGPNAEDWVARLGDDFLNNAHVLLFGFGSGYHPLYLFRLSDAQTYIWIVEPDPALLKAAFHLMDFTSLILSPRVRFVVGLREDETARLLFTEPGGHRTRAQGIRLAYTGTAKALYADRIQRLAQAIEEILRVEGLKFKTSEIQGEIILRNLLANLPQVLRGAPWLRLLGAAPGAPALVISPGPSLEAALPSIARARDNALVIAVDTAYRILRRHGLASDIVVSLDFTELNARHFDAIELDDAVLLAFPGVHSSIPARFPSRTFFYDHAGTAAYGPGATPLLKTFTCLGRLGDLVSYGSTAHAAYHAARMMGCSPIILIGNDLGFPGAKQYAPGAMQTEFPAPMDVDDSLATVPANDGQAISTSGLYKFYLDGFSELIQATGGEVINTAPHGAVIPGCRFMPLEDALARHVRQQMIDRSFLRDALRPTLEAKRGPLILELGELAGECGEARMHLRGLEERLNTLDPAAPTFRQELIQTLKSFAEILRQSPRAVSLSLTLCARSTHGMLGQLNQGSFFGGDTPAMNLQARGRCQAFFQDLERGMEIHQHAFTRAAAELSNPRKSKAEMGIPG
ncbi:MAG: motility associated factor glycosyltransferase family protein [bacterium]